MSNIKCSCSQFAGIDRTGSSSNNDDGGSHGAPTDDGQSTYDAFTTVLLDASFVNLPLSTSIMNCNNNRNSYATAQRTISEERNTSFDGADDGQANEGHDGFWTAHKQTQLLREIALSPSNDSLHSLCKDCVGRIKHAIEVNTKRLNNESDLLNEAVLDQEAQISNLKRTLEILFVSNGSDTFGNVENEELFNSLLHANTESELELLQTAIQQCEDEILQLTEMRRQQAMAESELVQVEKCLEEEKNDLYVESSAFVHDQKRLSLLLLEAQSEIERLSSPSIRFASQLFDLQVDRERGLRYPLINELRLAYRPKGDIKWAEIQAAWSCAAHLLLVIGTIFEFRSLNWKLIPLSNCAKLIYYNNNNSKIDNSTNDNTPSTAVYNLGHPRTQGKDALIAWNGLLYEITQHIEARIKELIKHGITLTKPNTTDSKSNSHDNQQTPYLISRNSIGGLSLPNLDEDDDSAWSRVIQYMSCNLEWLSDCASAYCLQKVVLGSSSATT